MAGPGEQVPAGELEHEPAAVVARAPELRERGDAQVELEGGEPGHPPRAGPGRQRAGLLHGLLRGIAAQARGRGDLLGARLGPRRAWAAAMPRY